MNATSLVVTADSTADAEIIRQLRATVESVEAERIHLTAILSGATQMHRNDIRLIGERLISEAQERGWCDQYDTIIEELNADLHVELPEREREYTVTATVRVEITVNARDQDSARSAASNTVYRLERLLDAEDDVTSHWDSSECFEVEEVEES